MKKLLVVLLGLASLNVCVANPTYDATRGALQNDPGLCQYGYNPNCSSGNQRSITSKKRIVYVSKYGAVATNERTGISSGALNKDSLEEAKHEAIKACEQGGVNAPCKVAMWVSNACIAAAAGKEGQKFRIFYTARDKSGQAEHAALQKCKKAGLKNCEITIPEGCSFP